MAIIELGHGKNGDGGSVEHATSAVVGGMTRQTGEARSGIRNLITALWSILHLLCRPAMVADMLRVSLSARTA